MRSMTRRDRRRRGTGARAVLGTTAVIAAGVLVGVAAAGGTYAFWNESITAEGDSVSTGSIALTVDEKATLKVDDLDFSGLYPRSSVVRGTPLTVANGGTVPLSVSWTGTAVESGNSDLASSLVVSLRPATAATCSTTPPATPLSTTLSPLALDPDESDELCLEVRLDESAPSSVRKATGTITLTLTGEQVRP